MLTSRPRLTESPEIIRLGGKVTANYEHPSAWAFSIINSVVAVTGGTHPTIFSALRMVTLPNDSMAQMELDAKGQRQIYKEYGVKFAPHLPTAKDLEWYSSNWTGQMGLMRERTKSGRVWKSIQIDNDKVSAISFWARRKQITDQDIQLLVSSMKLQTPLYVEFMDSKNAEVYHGSVDTHDTKALKSQVDPGTSPEAIIDILARAHAAPHTLTAREKAIAAEFRGTTTPPAPPVSDQEKAGMSRAEINYRKKLGDSAKFEASTIEGLGNYTSPGDPIKLFWDFYCLYTLSFKYGDLFHHYYPNKPQDDIINFRVAETINEAFFSVKERIKSLMLKRVPLVCLDEVLNLNYTRELDLEQLYLWMFVHGKVDKHTPLPQLSQAMAVYLQQKAPHLHGGLQAWLSGLLALIMQNVHVSGVRRVTFVPDFLPDDELIGFIQSQGGVLSLKILEDLFTLLHWDEGYGGHMWFEICQLIRQLNATKTLKTEIFLIDRLYDIEHNTGRLLEKIPALHVPKAELDKRFLIREPREFIPHVSSDCRKLVIAVSRVAQRAAA